MAGEQTLDPLVAEHGFSALVTVRKGQAEHRILFDAGVSPDGVVENMRRLDIDPGSIEAIVCSHGHFDHTGGIEGHESPLGVVWGDQDPIAVPAMAERLVQRRAATGSTSPLIVLEGVGHYPMVEDPTRFTDAVLSLFDQIER